MFTVSEKKMSSNHPRSEKVWCQVIRFAGLAARKAKG